MIAGRPEFDPDRVREEMRRSGVDPSRFSNEQLQAYFDGLRAIAEAFGQAMQSMAEGAERPNLPPGGGKVAQGDERRGDHGEDSAEE